ncbi:multicopper oxidase domain-containing protein [Mobilicoccus massiliensis]|uniref:multicopper oxidase domain-containing protein n=1 Tax=Mobilicoccus massiliensis TaxID=1522310 RepID=UPI001FE796DF|nr:multicopper oxidase domain-containing protein [Mobilicoccus massiliensis]
MSGAAYRILAIDGEDLFGPSQVTGRSLTLTAGARADLEVVVPPGGARVQLPGISIAVAPSEVDAPSTSAPRDEVDLLGYGTAAPLGFDPRKPDRVFDYRIGRRVGLLDGRPGLWWTINGGIVPDVPMYVVREGDVVVFRITNDSGDVHPMHLHGHHATILSRNGIGSTGSPWRVDSLNVRDGESFEVAFVADNPGVWMDHCHNLPHAREGLMTHLMYEGVTTPFLLGTDSGNEPE